MWPYCTNHDCAVIGIIVSLTEAHGWNRVLLCSCMLPPQNVQRYFFLLLMDSVMYEGAFLLCSTRWIVSLQVMAECHGVSTSLGILTTKAMSF